MYGTYSGLPAAFGILPGLFPTKGDEFYFFDFAAMSCPGVQGLQGMQAGPPGVAEWWATQGMPVQNGVGQKSPKNFAISRHDCNGAWQRNWQRPWQRQRGRQEPVARAMAEPTRHIGMPTSEGRVMENLGLHVENFPFNREMTPPPNTQNTHNPKHSKSLSPWVFAPSLALCCVFPFFLTKKAKGRVVLQKKGEKNPKNTLKRLKKLPVASKKNISYFFITAGHFGPIGKPCLVPRGDECGANNSV